MRAVVCLVAVALLAGCVSAGQPSSRPSAVSATVLPSPSATVTRTAAPNPGSTTVACLGVSPAVEYLPDVRLHLASEPEQYSVYGVNGSRTGDTATESSDWHQPPPSEALVAARGEAVLVRPFYEDVGRACLESVFVEAAPFSPIAVAPAAPVPLGARAASLSRAPEFSFLAPTQPGEWVVRVNLAYGTSPDRTRRSTFFRLRVDVPPPRVDGTATAPVGCAPPGARQPGVFLSIDGAQPIQGGPGGFTWRGTSAQGGPPVGAPIVIDHGARLKIATGGDVCAGWWRIQLAPTPESEWGPFEAITDLVPDYLTDYYDMPPGAANRFKLADTPPGDWVLKADLWYADSRDKRIGQTSAIWHIVVR